MILPKARSQNIVVQELAKECLVYNLVTNKAFCLNETSTIVYQACGSRATFDELKRKYNLTEELIFLALDELKNENLIEGEYQSSLNGLSRREALRKVGLATIIALPLITSIVAPKAVHAQSGGNTCGAGCSCSLRNNTAQAQFCGLQLGGDLSGCALAPGCDCLVDPSSGNGNCDSVAV